VVALNIINIIKAASKDSSLNRFSLVFIIIVLYPRSKIIAIAVNEMNEYHPTGSTLPSVTKYCILNINRANKINVNESPITNMD